MRVKWIVSALAVSGLALAVIVWQSSGQVPGKGANDNGKTAEASLPIKHVVLFNSGVAYFQRDGFVEGNTHVDLSFPASDINDLLKSLVLQDSGGGTVSSVNYDSHDPIDKILHSFALDLNNNPTFSQILNQARGEKIEVTLRPAIEYRLSPYGVSPYSSVEKPAEPKTTRQVGTIVGMEVRHNLPMDGIYSPYMSMDKEMLNLTGEAGLQSFALDQIVAVRFLNPTLDSEFQRALKVLAASHDTQKKTVSLGFVGQGKRPVKVGYVVEHPIWKTSYRLRIEPNGKLSLQGWAIVENTSDNDWNDVQMVLVSGRPITYKMNLYEPLYIPRPMVEPELFASLRPPVYGGAMQQQDAWGPNAAAPPVPAPMAGYPPMQQPGMAGVAQNPYQGQMFQPYYQVNPNMVGGLSANSMMNAPMNGMYPMNPQMNGMNGMNGQFNNFQQNPMAQNPMGQNRLSYEELQTRLAQQRQKKDDGKRVGTAITGLNFKEGIASVATADELGDYYQYTVDKISLPRQKSAMLPILDQTIAGSKVSIYNPATHAKFPLLGLRLKNSSGQPLNQGPISVFEEGSYSGDTRILDLQTNEERLLSYAIDQAVEIKSDVKSTPSPDMHFKMDEASLAANYKMRETRTYTIKNRATKERTVILEQAIRGDWKLVEPKKAQETTRDLYRFQVQVPAEKTVTFDVVEEHSRTDQLAFSIGHPLNLSSIGITVKVQTQVSPEKLLGLKIQKGFLLPTHQARESRTYFIQNLSDIAREFTVDHIVRANWVRVDSENPQRGPAVYRFVLKVSKDKTETREIIEERIYEFKGGLARDLSEEKANEYLNSPILKADVKSALTKVLGMTSKLAETRKKLDEQEKLLKQLTDDQARMRENLNIIPQGSEPYKKFLDKFVSQETEIEGFQKQIRQYQATVQQQQRELEVFMSALTVE